MSYNNNKKKMILTNGKVLVPTSNFKSFFFKYIGFNNVGYHNCCIHRLLVANSAVQHIDLF